MTNLSQSAPLPTWADTFGSVGMSVVKTNPNDSDKSVSDTVRLMGQHSRDAAPSPQVKAALQEAGALQSGLTEDEVIQKVFTYIKGKVRFVQDEHQLESIFSDPTSKELLITPPALLSMARPAGDCDDFSMLCCSMLMAKGIKCDFVTIAADSRYPNEFSHIYCVARTRDGRSIPLDISHGKSVGWETNRSTRKMVWPVFDFGFGGGWGRTDDESKGGMGMLVGAKSYHKDWDTQFRKGLSGLLGALGDCAMYDDSGNCLVDTSTSYDPTVTMTGPNPTSQQIASGMPSSSSSSSPSATINWNNILPGLFSSVEKIAQQTSQPAGTQQTTCNAQGICSSVSQVLPAGATTASSLNLLGSSSINSTYLIIGVIAVAALFMMEK